MRKNRYPDGLGKEGRSFWKRVNSEYQFDAAHDLERLLQACKLLDSIAAAEAVIQEEGRYILDRFQQRREHPALKTCRDSMTLFVRIIRELGLDLSNAPESRPPRRY